MIGDQDIQDAYEADDSSLNPRGNEHKEVTETEDDDITYVSHTYTKNILGQYGEFILPFHPSRPGRFPHCPLDDL